MKFIDRIIQLFKNKNPMDEYSSNQEKIKQSLTNLIYQHSKMLDKQSNLLDENESLALDLEDSVKGNTDEISLKVIEKLEQNKEELSFLDQQILELESNITELKNTKKEIDLSKGRYSDLLTIHESKRSALRAKKDILQQLNDLNSNREALSSKNYLADLKDQIHRTNAEITLLQDETRSDDSINGLRTKRIKRNHLKKLQTLKENLHSNNVIIVK